MKITDKNILKALKEKKEICMYPTPIERYEYTLKEPNEVQEQYYCIHGESCKRYFGTIEYLLQELKKYIAVGHKIKIQ